MLDRSRERRSISIAIVNSRRMALLLPDLCQMSNTAFERGRSQYAYVNTQPSKHQLRSYANSSSHTRLVNMEDPGVSSSLTRKFVTQSRTNTISIVGAN